MLGVEQGGDGVVEGGVVAALGAQERGAFVGRALERRVEQGVGLGPAVGGERGHGDGVGVTHRS